MKYYTVNVNVRHTFPNATAAFSSFYCYPLSLSYCCACNRFHRVSNQSHLPFSLSRPSTWYVVFRMKSISPTKRGDEGYCTSYFIYSTTNSNIMTNTATQSLPHSLPLPLSCLILLECTKFNDEETSERSIPIIQWWCVQVNSPTLTPLAARKGYYASINDATALKLYPRDAIWTVRDGVVGVPVIRMPWGDNMGEEVVVGRMILADSGHSQTT